MIICKCDDLKFYYDQYYREEITNNKDGKKTDSIRRIQVKYDLLNVAILDSIIKTIGWPNIGKVGYEASSVAFLITQHAPIEFQKKHLDSLEYYAKLGEIDAYDFFYLKDRITVNETNKQIFGTQFYYDTIKKVYVPFDLIYPISVIDSIKSSFTSNIKIFEN